MKQHLAPYPILACGAVSAAGWGCTSLVEAVVRDLPLPLSPPETTAEQPNPRYLCRRVPMPAAAWMPKGPRFRRSSPVTRFAAAAAQEAIDRAGIKPQRLGLVLCLMNGCVNFSNRFYREVLQDPATASPIIFPETVFNAPASHVAAHLGADGPVSTLIGDSDAVLAGLEMAGDWLAGDLVDACLVIAAEEFDWLTANGAGYYHRDIVASEGAAALLLGREGRGPRVQELVAPSGYASRDERTKQTASMARQLITAFDHYSPTCLIDDCIGIVAQDQAETAAWAQQPTLKRLSPKRVLGHTLGASAGLQLVVAAELARAEAQSIAVSVPGNNFSAWGCIIG
jgi:3-oxoacyl-[acyl-carrier-protein] synthase II